MANRKLMGLFQDPQKVADAVTSFKEAGFPPEDVDIYSGTPYPEGSFGEYDPPHRLYLFPLVGAMVGFAIGLLYTSGTQIAYPLIQGGKPILSIPPMTIIMYENTMLGAIIFTVLGVLFESRLPKRSLGLYDTRITEGYIGLVVDSPEAKVGDAERVLQAAGAEEIKREEVTA